MKTFLEDLDAYAAAYPVAAVPTGGVLIISHNKEFCEALVKGGYLTALGDFVSDFHGVHPESLVTYRCKFVQHERVGILLKKNTFLLSGDLSSAARGISGGSVNCQSGCRMTCTPTRLSEVCL